MKRFSLRVALSGLAILCVGFAALRAVTTWFAPITVTADRPDVIAYLDDIELGPVPAKIPWSLLHERYGLSATGPFKHETMESWNYGVFMRAQRQSTGRYPLIYLKPMDERSAVQDGFDLVDSPFGKIVDPQLAYWLQRTRSVHFTANLPRDTSQRRATIGRAAQHADGSIHVAIRFPFSKAISPPTSASQVSIILSTGTFTDWRQTSKAEVVDVNAMRTEDDSRWHEMSIAGNPHEKYQWIKATVYDTSGNRIPGISSKVPVVTLKDGNMVGVKEAASDNEVTEQ